MRRTVVIAPGLLSGPSDESFLRQKLPALSMITERGSLSKIAVPPPSETPEAMLLGLGPSDVRLAQGPLTVSALGFDPPERSTHFHLSLTSFVDGAVVDPGVLPRPGEVEVFLAAAKRLDTKLLTVLSGEILDHALVWESLGDMSTTPVTSANGNVMRSCLPEGDGEVVLRRFIDDSVNLLSELEVNERRLDEGLPPFNLLWPWGHGVRAAVPNLALRRGEPAFVESGSLRLAGLVRLAGYRHVDRVLFGHGLGTRLRPIAERAMSRDLTIIYIDAVEQLRRESKWEEIEWFVREMDRELLRPLLDDQVENPSVLTLISPGSIDGLSVSCVSDRPGDNPYPFDERSLDERKVPTIDLWSAVQGGI